jgi:16S rRNA (uracil1498-N3)-methyltransferase
MVFVDDLDDPLLDLDDQRHLMRSLRLRPGERVLVSNGRGQWRRCVYRGERSGSRELCIDSQIFVEQRKQPEVDIGFALLKGGRTEWAVQKLVEVGVDRIIPFTSNRSVAKGDGPDKGIVSRLRRVAIQAAMQSRHAWLPIVEEVAPFPEVVGGHIAGGRLALAHPEGRPLNLDYPTVLIGPEGGFDETEMSLCPQKVKLADHILRSETAAVVAGAILCAMRSRLLAPL